MIACWGILETSEKPTGGAAASWIPVAGWFVPDTDQQMRVRLRIIVLDVRTGRWRSILPAPFDDSRMSSLFTREGSDREQVQRLLQAALPAAVEELTRGL